jgi:Rieske Fe-S protein
VNRRKFLETAGVIAASIPMATGVGGCAMTGLTTYRRTAHDRRLELTPGDYPELASPGGAIEIEVDELSDSIVVVRTGTSEYATISSVCTHLGCTVRKDGSFFRCPCHGSTYAMDGSVVRGPAERNLTTYQTELLGGILIIHL